MPQKGEEINGKKTQKREQKKIQTTYERVDCSLGFKREMCKGKEDLRKSKILTYSQEDKPRCLGMQSSKEEPNLLKISVKL